MYIYPQQYQKLSFHCYVLYTCFKVSIMSCYIAIEGFQVSRRYVIKEMTVLFDSNCYQHFHFNCPIDLIIGPRDWNTIRWQQNNSGLILQDDSYLPYEMVSYIFSRLLHLRIYTAGNQSATTLSYFMPKADIVDICQEWDFKYPTVLEDSPCLVKHNSRYCSLSKAKTIRTAVQIYQIRD